MCVLSFPLFITIMLGPNQSEVTKFWHLLNILSINEANDDPERIKEHMKSLQYPRTNFYCLPNTKTTGSKELLLATSFMLPKGVEVAIAKEIAGSPLNPKFNMLKDVTEYADSLLDVSGFTCERDFQRYTDWVKGRTLQNLREIKELQVQNKKIIAKLKNSSPSNSDESNPNEILARNSRIFRKLFIEKTERITAILNNHREWTKNETVFWQWMASLLEAPTEKERKSKLSRVTKK